MFGTLGGPELLLILVIALIVFGPRKLPEIGKSIGKMMVEFRRASNDFKRTIEDEVEADKMRAALDAPVTPLGAADAALERIKGPGEDAAPSPEGVVPETLPAPAPAEDGSTQDAAVPELK